MSKAGEEDRGIAYVSICLTTWSRVAGVRCIGRAVLGVRLGCAVRMRAVEIQRVRLTRQVASTERESLALVALLASFF